MLYLGINLDMQDTMYDKMFTCSCIYMYNVNPTCDRTNYVDMQENCERVSPEYIIYQAHLCLMLSKV